MASSAAAPGPALGRTATRTRQQRRGAHRRGSTDNRRPELLATALRERRPEGVAMLMDAHGRALKRVLHSVLRDGATAEDVLQQVLVEIWQRGPRYDPDRASVLTWALTIARSRAIDELRRRVPEPVDPTSAFEGATGATDDGTEAMLERWRLAALLDEIPADSSKLLRMRFHAGLSQTEIAEHTGIPLGTVKTRMVRGLAKLRELLEAEEDRRLVA